MPPAKDSSFPASAFAEAARVYAEENDLPGLAARCGTRKKGYRLQMLGVDAVADLFAEHLAGNASARRYALEQMLDALGGPPAEVSAEEPAPLRKRLRALPLADARARARWILVLLQDPRPEMWPLVSALRRPGGKGVSAKRAPAGKAHDAARLRAELERAHAKLGTLREERDRLARDGRALNREVAREIERRKRAERDLERERDAARRSAEEAATAKEELKRRTQRAGQVGDAAASVRERRDLQARLNEKAEQYALLARDYSSLKDSLHALKDRMAERWTEGKLEPKDLRPMAGGDPVIVEPPLETDTRPAADKVRMPTDPHHWPGGSTRFRAFLAKIARCEQVTRVVPRAFQHPTRHAIAFVTDSGDIVAKVSEGDHAAIVLILTTATHRGQGEFVRGRIEPLFAEGRL